MIKTCASATDFLTGAPITYYLCLPEAKSECTMHAIYVCIKLYPSIRLPLCLSTSQRWG